MWCLSLVIASDFHVEKGPGDVFLSASTIDPARTTTGMRRMLFIASILVLTIGVSLYVLTERTDTYFAWTIAFPFTAAFLGAGYWTSFVIELLASRERVWAQARVAVPAVWVFTTLTLIITIIHLDRFHFNAPEPYTVFGTWVWLVVYASVPLVVGVLFIRQLRVASIDPPIIAALPAWYRAGLVAQGAVMLIVGVVMILTPATMIPLWPWPLTPLTCQAVGAWGVGLGIAATHAALENDWFRLRPFVMSHPLFAVLQFVNLLRYPQALSWQQASAWLYLALIASILFLGAYGLWMNRRVNRDLGPDYARTSPEAV
jgi:hypothetical protein